MHAHSRSLMRASIAALLLIAPPLLLAQQPAPQVQQATPPGSSAALEFPGGSVLDYYNTIQKGRPEISLVLHPDLARVKMPPVSIARFDPHHAVRLPSMLIEGVIFLDANRRLAEEGVFKDPEATLRDLIDRGVVSAVISVEKERVKDWIRQGAREVKISFPGGTLKEYVEMVRAQFPDASVIMTPAARTITIPDMQLNLTKWREAIDILSQLKEDGVPKLIISPSEQSQIIDAFYGHGSGNQTHLLVWTLDHAIQDGRTPESILSAVQAALSLVDGPPPVVKFHPETNLLMAHGTNEQLDAIRNVIMLLQMPRNQSQQIPTPVPEPQQQVPQPKRPVQQP